MRLCYLFACILFLPFNSYAKSSCTSDNCMIVIDAGSTGSRAHLYQYRFGPQNTPLKIQELKSKSISPGLATLKADSFTIEHYFKELLSDFEQNISLPVYVYSTAGMRLVVADKQKKMYQLIGQWFNDNPKLHLLEAKTISGQEEGLYGWLAVNYLSGTFSKSNSSKIGMMDFGGASIQIAFPVEYQQALDNPSVFNILISGKKYYIYSQSFLGLGINEVTKQYLTDESCFARLYPLPDNVLGNGDVVQCEEHIETLSNRLHHVDSVQTKYSALRMDKWVGLGALGYLHNSVPFKSLSSPLMMKQVITLAQNGICQLPWEQVRSQDPDNEYLYNTCLAGAYYYAIVVKGYGLDETTAIETEVTSAKQVLDWTSGVVIQNHAR